MIKSEKTNHDSEMLNFTEKSLKTDLSDICTASVPALIAFLGTTEEPEKWRVLKHPHQIHRRYMIHQSGKVLNVDTMKFMKRHQKAKRTYYSLIRKGTSEQRNFTSQQLVYFNFKQRIPKKVLEAPWDYRVMHWDDDLEDCNIDKLFAVKRAGRNAIIPLREVINIRDRWANTGVTIKSLMDEYEVSHKTIRWIVDRVTWQLPEWEFGNE